MGQLTKQFGKIKISLPIPHLLNLQIDSYQKFLQEGVPEADRRPDEGLEGVFHTVFPIEDFNKTASLEFVSYEVQEPKYDQAECISKGLTYEAPMRIKVRLVVYDADEASGNRTIRDIKEQDIYFGTLPLMTEKGTFIINGTERVIVNQLQRSPGIIFEHDGGKTHTSRKVLYSCRVIPMRGSWLDFDFDHKDILYVRIDRRRKMPATILFKAMGMSKEQILDYFYSREQYLLEDGGRLFWEVRKDLYRKDNAYADITAPDGNVLVKAGKPITKRSWRLICEAGIPAIEVRPDLLDGMFLAEDAVAPLSGEVLAEAADEITPGLLERMREAGIKRLSVLHTKGTDTSSSIRDTLVLDRIPDQQKAQEEIYRRLRPSSPPTAEIAASFFDNLFRNPDYYDLSPVGRYKLNQRLGIDAPADLRTLNDEDILTAIKVLVQLKDSHGPADDIDHLGNRRVRLVGELVENQYRIGLVRMERAIKERMSLQEISTLMPHDLINPKPVAAVLKEFFGTSQLSQFMDQTNSLSEVTHKRRLSALGPGGLTRERAGFEVRDVHTSHYGRICPIETPEGPNIGLIVSLTTFAKVNDYGFIETPYRVVREGRVTDEVVHLDASREGDQLVAQADARLDGEGHLLEEFVTVRVKGEVEMRHRDEVTLMDISPSQMVSISAALIPFLEHDDANRALMGSNMQRQAVPLLRSEKPLVGTGMEVDVARDSGACIVAPADGKVQYADADRIVVAYEGDIYKDQGGVRAYDLLKFHKSNQNSCFGQKPTCYPGQIVKKGQILADGPGIDEGQLALGKNLVVAFMPWCGYNYEDSVLISEKVVADDRYTSIHIEELSVVARDTKLGAEEITRDISNLPEQQLNRLDDAGIVFIGAEVEAGDVLVGKVTPKGETQLTPEEKLLRVIFGEKASDVKDTSLRVPSGMSGTVIDVQVFTREGVERDSRAKSIIEDELKRYQRDLDDERRIVETDACARLRRQITGKKVLTAPNGLGAGSVLTTEYLEGLNYQQLFSIVMETEDDQKLIDLTKKALENKVKEFAEAYNLKKDKLTRGDELPPGVLKMVKVYIAERRRLQPGDKMAGRHGNKGVVSKVNPVEDMPYMADGRPMDIVLNPLGVPSRMNIGQVLEVHLGWAAKGLGWRLQELLDSERGKQVKEIRAFLEKVYNMTGKKEDIASLTDDEVIAMVNRIKHGIPFATPVFDGASEEQIKQMLEMAFPDSEVKRLQLTPNREQATLYDGRTGDAFTCPVTVGYMHYLKLHHLVDDKMHARSTGPYSLVTQQPLGGKAQFGGQRFGEMEVWALEAYGAAYTLQEMLTVKSDDVNGRTKMYENIVKGDLSIDAGIPESFNVLVREIRSLGIDIDYEKN